MIFDAKNFFSFSDKTIFFLLQEKNIVQRKKSCGKEKIVLLLHPEKSSWHQKKTNPVHPEKNYS